MFSTSRLLRAAALRNSRPFVPHGSSIRRPAQFSTSGAREAEEATATETANDAPSATASENLGTPSKSEAAKVNDSNGARQTTKQKPTPKTSGFRKSSSSAHQRPRSSNLPKAFVPPSSDGTPYPPKLNSVLGRTPTTVSQAKDDTPEDTPEDTPGDIPGSFPPEATPGVTPGGKRDGSPIDWASSYYGISSKPVTLAQYNTLMEPLELSDIEIKPDGVLYLPEIKYRRKLNLAFGPMGWGMIPRGDAVVGTSVVTREYALIIDGRFVAQAQGENTYFSVESLPSSVEGCKSNALMRCCKDLGIASELWDPIFIRWFRKTHTESRWVEHTVTKKKRQMWFRKDAVEVQYPYKLS